MASKQLGDYGLVPQAENLSFLTYVNASSNTYLSELLLKPVSGSLGGLSKQFLILVFRGVIRETWGRKPDSLVSDQCAFPLLDLLSNSLKFMLSLELESYSTPEVSKL